MCWNFKDWKIKKMWKVRVPNWLCANRGSARSQFESQSLSEKLPVQLWDKWACLSFRQPNLFSEIYFLTLMAFNHLERPTLIKGAVKENGSWIKKWHVFYESTLECWNIKIFFMDITKSYFTKNFFRISASGPIQSIYRVCYKHLSNNRVLHGTYLT